MNPRISLASVVLPALFTALAFTQSTTKPDAPKSEIQTRAEALMDRARHLSDIRAKDAPAFRLKATFSFPGKDLNPVQGTYTETWVSQSQWRREIVAGESHRIEVGGPDKRWLLDSTPDFPETAAKLPDLMNIFPRRDQTFEFASIDQGADPKSPEDCAITKPGSREEKYAFCFDKKSGALLEKGEPDIRPKNAVTSTCLYGIFRKLGEFWYPREMACFEDKHKKLEAKIEELSTEPSPDPTLFKPPPGATERTVCNGEKAPPRQIFAPEPNFPGDLSPATVSLSLLVDVEGKPKEIKVVRSGGKAFDDQAVREQLAVSGSRPLLVMGSRLPRRSA